MTNYPKPNLTRIFLAEFAILSTGALVAYLLDKTIAASASFFLGGLSIYIPNLFFAVKFFSFKGAASGIGMQKLLAYQAGKFALAIICLAISLFLLIYLSAFASKYFLGAYIFLLVLHIFFSSKIK